jgi:hypothetical protein
LVTALTLFFGALTNDHLRISKYERHQPGASS